MDAFSFPAPRFPWLSNPRLFASSSICTLLYCGVLKYAVPDGSELRTFALWVLKLMKIYPQLISTSQSQPDPFGLIKLNNKARSQEIQLGQRLAGSTGVRTVLFHTKERQEYVRTFVMRSNFQSSLLSDLVCDVEKERYLLLITKQRDLAWEVLFWGHSSEEEDSTFRDERQIRCLVQKCHTSS